MKTPSWQHAPKVITVRNWMARKFKLNVKRGPVQHRIQRARISGTTWPTEQIAVAERPRVIHNIQKPR